MTKMTMENATTMGLFNADKWYGKRNDFMVKDLGEYIGVGHSIIPKMLFVTSKDFQFGAACLSHPEIFEEIARKSNSDLLIIPSSIHEVIVVYLKEIEKEAINLSTIIKGINSEMVDVDERLGENPLFYKKGSFEITKY